MIQLVIFHWKHYFKKCQQWNDHLPPLGGCLILPIGMSRACCLRPDEDGVCTLVPYWEWCEKKLQTECIYNSRKCFTSFRSVLISTFVADDQHCSNTSLVSSPSTTDSYIWIQQVECIKSIFLKSHILHVSRIKFFTLSETWKRPFF